MIDLAEYSESEGGVKTVEYFQLKHSTIRVNKPFPGSELTETLKGFGQRYSSLLAKQGVQQIERQVKFSFVSNRPVKAVHKEAIRLRSYPKSMNLEALN